MQHARHADEPSPNRPKPHDIGRNHRALGRSHAKFGRTQPNLGGIRSSSAQVRSKPTEALTKPTRIWPRSAQTPAEANQIWSSATKFGRLQIEFGRYQPKFGRAQPELVDLALRLIAALSSAPNPSGRPLRHGAQGVAGLARVHRLVITPARPPLRRQRTGDVFCGGSGALWSPPLSSWLAMSWSRHTFEDGGTSQIAGKWTDNLDWALHK